MIFSTDRKNSFVFDILTGMNHLKVSFELECTHILATRQLCKPQLTDVRF